MAEPTFETLLQKTFDDIKQRREKLLAQRVTVERELADCERDYRRYQTAHEALQGRFDQPTKAPRKPREGGGKRAPRGRRGEMREKILFMLGEGPLTADAIYVELQATDQKSKQAVSNLLGRLKADGVIQQEGPKKPYTLNPAAREAA